MARLVICSAFFPPFAIPAPEGEGDGEWEVPAAWCLKCSRGNASPLWILGAARDSCPVTVSRPSALCQIKIHVRQRPNETAVNKSLLRWRQKNSGSELTLSNQHLPSSTIHPLNCCQSSFGLSPCPSRGTAPICAV
ncbi:hypothetical protein HDV57DRAFT_101416 [Trichoderma longibrachiatum]